MPMLPELVLLAGAFMLLLAGVTRFARISMPMVGAVLVLLAAAGACLPMYMGDPVVALNGMYVADGFSGFAKALVLAAAALTLLFSADWLTEGEGRPFEFLVLVLFATAGMLFVVSAHDLIPLYVSFELMSLALYVLAAFNRDNAKSGEAGLKYFMLGALASGMLLYGMSLVYGFTGATGFEAIAKQISLMGEEGAGVPQPLILGLVLILVGFCFKLSAVPFHMWTPDVYEGAPTPVTAFFAVAPKAAMFAVLARVLEQPFGEAVNQWRQILIVISFLSMAVGALAALRQTNIKRLLAYSAIGHAGFMLMGLAAGTGAGVQAMLIYLVTYLFMSAGAFGCVLLMRRGGVYVEQISDLAGLARARPGLAFAMAAFMFSMAGIPPLAGFFGKLYVVLAAIEANLIPLAVAGLLTSVISCYYYLRVVKFMYFDEAALPLDGPAPLGARVGLVLTTGATLLFFLVPSPLVATAKAAAAILLH